MFRKLGLPVMILLVGIGLPLGVHAQSSTAGTISGTVRDPKGAVIPGAEVVLEQQGTGLSRTIKADKGGFYSAPSLPAGHYTISTAPQGFKKTVVTDVDLHVAEDKVVDLELQV